MVPKDTGEQKNIVHHTESKTFRMVVLGYSGVGKTSICSQYTANHIPRHHYRTHGLHYYCRESRSAPGRNPLNRRRNRQMMSVSRADLFYRKTCSLPKYGIQLLDVPGTTKAELVPGTLEKELVQLEYGKTGFAYGDQSFGSEVVNSRGVPRRNNYLQAFEDEYARVSSRYFSCVYICVCAFWVPVVASML